MPKKKTASKKIASKKTVTQKEVFSTNTNFLILTVFCFLVGCIFVSLYR